ncbi:tlde1 domain-containing protein [Rahnella sp. EDr1-12]|uniref:tlde1 domain-containing protein n=1 Tax=unclassified Rahnella TaxID=2635087 RepID=UPI003BAC84EA
MNDETFIEGVKRGSFRLHPIGPKGLSEGCITMTSQSDFDYLRTALLGTSMIGVPGSSLKAHGTIRVTLG